MPETQTVRKGEELDLSSLTDFLNANLNVGPNDVFVRQFPAGSSNLTYLVQVGDTDYVLRRPPFGNTVRSAHDMAREFNVLSKLADVYSPAPRPLLFCDDPSIIGSDFYLMERRKGLVIRGTFPDPSPLESADLRADIARSFVRNLSHLHSLDYEAAGLGFLGKPEGYNRRQVEGWTKRYFAAKTDEHDDVEFSIEWLNENIQPEFGSSLIHNDYKFDNVMLDPDDLTKITAVLDWEMVTLGDPLMDVGTALGYWMSRAEGNEMLNMPFNPRILMENISRDQLADMYEQALGRPLPDMLFYYVFGTIKIAVICQQIYARFVKGLTSDQRFAGFGTLVGNLGRFAKAAVDRGTLT